MPPADTTANTTETLAGFVDRHAQQRPDAIAIRYGERHWSWADWAARIRRAAGALRAAGVQRGQCVAFLDKNHPACLEVLFAAASIGAVTTIVNWRVAGDELVARARRQRGAAAFRRRRAAVRRRGGCRTSAGRGAHRRGGRRVRIPARRGDARPDRCRGRRERDRAGDLQLRHHRATEGRAAEPARAGQSRGEPGAGLPVRATGTRTSWPCPSSTSAESATRSSAFGPGCRRS